MSTSSAMRLPSSTRTLSTRPHGLVDVMGHHEHRGVVRGHEVAHEVLHLEPGEDVGGGEGFVEQA